MSSAAPRDGTSREARVPRGSADAVVLAAGRGVRLGALTERTPKVLLEVDGRALLDYHLLALRRVGVRRVILVVNYLAEQVERHVDGGRPFELDVTTVRQPEPRGTGDAVRVAIPFVRTDPFLVSYADVFLPNEDVVLQELLVDDRAKIVAAEVPNGGSFGRLSTRREGEHVLLEGLEEKDGRAVPALVNAGLYLFPKSILTTVAGLTPSVRGEYELTDAVRAFVGHGGEMHVVSVSDWVDAGTAESLARAGELARRTRR